MTNERLDGSDQRVLQGQHTHRRLLEIAQKSFAKQGFAGTTTADIIHQAGVTKGALYHHFPSKRHLFEAVYRAIEAEVAARIDAASAAANRPWEQLIAGCCAYLESFLNSDWYRILRIDGPAVLGHEQWAAIDAEHGLARLLPFLEFLQANRVIQVPSVPAFARLLTGAMNEASFWIAEAGVDPQGTTTSQAQALAASQATLIQLLEAARYRGAVSAASD